MRTQADPQLQALREQIADYEDTLGDLQKLVTINKETVSIFYKQKEGYSKLINTKLKEENDVLFGALLRSVNKEAALWSRVECFL